MPHLPRRTKHQPPGGQKKGKGGDKTVTVTIADQTKKILGVTTIVVRDIVKTNGEAVEDTVGWLPKI